MIFKKSTARIANFILKRRLKYRQGRIRRAKNLSEIRSVLVIYHYESALHQEIHDLIRFLKEERKTVTTLGYISNKKVEIPKNKLNEELFLQQQDLNFLRIPAKSEINRLVDEPFELLIDLNFTERIPMKYIFGMSNAGFKISGDLPYQQEHGDLTIDFSKNRTMSFQISQIKHYLKQINSNKVEYVSE